MSFVKADKRHDYGEDIVNTLFRNNALMLFDTPEVRKLGSELSTLSKSTPKTKAKDDFCDALRYGVATSVPWDWEVLHKDTSLDSVSAENSVAEWSADERERWDMQRRRGEDPDARQKDDWSEYYEEIDEWNEAYYA
jgi:hypothetical protein